MNHCELFAVKGLPVFQNKTFANQKAALASKTGDMRLVQDRDTGLIFNAAFDKNVQYEYDVGYQNEQARSGIFKHHLDEVRAIIERQLAGKSLIEVGCGKGYFLEYLRKHGFSIRGVDPAYEGNSLDVVKAAFSPGLELKAEGIVLRHVLEHVYDPCAFLGSIVEANGGEGKIYIEVPCFDWICTHRAWFDVYYEHVNYFRLADLHRMFGQVYESGHIFGGQYLYVVANLASLQRPEVIRGEVCNFPADFLSGIGKFAALAQRGRSAIWGGASKGVIFSLYLQRAGAAVDCAIDINPSKQNRYMAASGVRICEPAEGMARLNDNDNIFVMNSNYLQEIVEQTRNRFNYIKVDGCEF